MKIAVFGSARPQPGQPDYEIAYHLGRLIGQGGHILMTGGYMGTMEAASRGAAEAGGHVIGVTCEEIERWRPTGANRWVAEEVRMRTLVERIAFLIRESDAAIALPGGAGTLAEISLFWNHLIIQAIPPKPLVLIGTAWQSVFQSLFERMQGLLAENEQRWLIFALDYQSAYFEVLKIAQSFPKDGRSP
ncbi:LOG family protein [uncultured Thermanaerothrix sp.]|uniref:LOG family protein n=1 Tax=uncultured Thermanaerothrix sp. TaxID=1195149 RepID=UPI0026293628|nr:LOG family protein [uncultured Thermanaerothrix sp.]